MEGGGNCLEYPKKMEQKRGEEKQRFFSNENKGEKGGIGSRCGCLEKRGAGTPYKLC